MYWVWICSGLHAASGPKSHINRHLRKIGHLTVPRCLAGGGGIALICVDTYTYFTAVQNILLIWGKYALISSQSWPAKLCSRVFLLDQTNPLNLSCFRDLQSFLYFSLLQFRLFLLHFQLSLHHFWLYLLLDFWLSLNHHFWLSLQESVAQLCWWVWQTL